MKRTAIIGLGVTGYSCVRYLHGREQLLVVDTREHPPLLDALREAFPDVEVRTAATSLEAADLDRVIVSPGVELDSCLLRSVRGRVPFDSDIDIFCDAAAAPVIGITGTNGKSTVTSLTGHLLRSAGKCAPTGGNLGAAALDLLDPAADVYVLELKIISTGTATWPPMSRVNSGSTRTAMWRWPTAASVKRCREHRYRNC